MPLAGARRLWNPSARRSRLKFVWQSHDPSAGMIETTFAIGTPLENRTGQQIPAKIRIFIRRACPDTKYNTYE